MSDYPYGLDVRPLTTWPGTLTPAHQRKRSQFSAPIRNTLSILNRELWHLGANTSVMEIAIPPEQFRIDGRPRASAKAEHPGVVLTPQERADYAALAARHGLTLPELFRRAVMLIEAQEGIRV